MTEEQLTCLLLNESHLTDRTKTSWKKGKKVGREGRPPLDFQNRGRASSLHSSTSSSSSSTSLGTSYRRGSPLPSGLLSYRTQLLRVAFSPPLRQPDKARRPTHSSRHRPLASATASRSSSSCTRSTAVQDGIRHFTFLLLFPETSSPPSRSLGSFLSHRVDSNSILRCYSRLLSATQGELSLPARCTNHRGQRRRDERLASSRGAVERVGRVSRAAGAAWSYTGTRWYILRCFSARECPSTSQSRPFSAPPVFFPNLSAVGCSGGDGRSRGAAGSATAIGDVCSVARRALSSLAIPRRPHSSAPRVSRSRWVAWVASQDVGQRRPAGGVALVAIIASPPRRISRPCDFDLRRIAAGLER